jgi:hypothetical protein
MHFNSTDNPVFIN